MAGDDEPVMPVGAMVLLLQQILFEVQTTNKLVWTVMTPSQRHEFEELRK